jgi:hypothetical protein
MALILNPGFRTRYIKANWPKKYATLALISAKKFWEHYRDQIIPPPSSNIAPFSYGKEPSQEPLALDSFDRIARSLRSVTRPASEDEYEDYNSQESYDVGKQGALAWWSQDAQRERWPRLSLMAINILSIPPMSDEPERVFSGARRTVSWDRGQMEAEIMEIRECLKHWKRTGILQTFFETS